MRGDEKEKIEENARSIYFYPCTRLDPQCKIHDLEAMDLALPPKGHGAKLSK